MEQSQREAYANHWILPDGVERTAWPHAKASPRGVPESEGMTIFQFLRALEKLDGWYLEEGCAIRRVHDGQIECPVTAVANSPVKSFQTLDIYSALLAIGLSTDYCDRFVEAADWNMKRPRLRRRLLRATKLL